MPERWVSRATASLISRLASSQGLAFGCELLSGYLPARSCGVEDLHFEVEPGQSRVALGLLEQHALVARGRGDLEQRRLLLERGHAGLTSSPSFPAAQP
jgi:hypothetical protein